MKMMISVIIPVYKVEKYLRYCLDSLLAQTYTDFEAILVDDGSPDGSGSICEEYAARDDRFRVIHQENKGLSGARNAGLAVARGEYVTLADSDDVLHPNYLEYLYHCAMVCHARVAMCCYRRISENQLSGGEKLFAQQKEVSLPENLQWEIATDAEGEAIRYCSGREAAKLIVRDGLRYAIIAVAKLYHRSLLPLLHYPEGKYHEDEFVTYRVLDSCESVAVSGKTYYGYLKRSDGITGKYHLKRMDSLDAMREAVAYFEGKKDAEMALAAKKRLLVYLPAVWYYIHGTYPERTDLLADVRMQQNRLWKENKRGVKPLCSLTDRISLSVFHISPRLYCAFAGLYLKLFPEK